MFTRTVPLCSGPKSVDLFSHREKMKAYESRDPVPLFSGTFTFTSFFCQWIPWKTWLHFLLAVSHQSRWETARAADCSYHSSKQPSRTCIGSCVHHFQSQATSAVVLLPCSLLNSDTMTFKTPPLFLCVSMEPSPLTVPGALTCLPPTSGLPESMTVGECFSFPHLSLSVSWCHSSCCHVVVKPVLQVDSL